MPADFSRHFCLFAATALVTFIARWEELINRKAHLAEQFARVVGRRAALLVRQTVVVNGDEHLHVAHQLHNGENTDCDIDETLTIFSEVSAVGRADVFGDIAAAATAASASNVTFFGDAAAQDDGLCNLYAAARHIACGHFLPIVLFGTEFTAEHLDATFAAVENYLFVKHSHAVDGGTRNPVTGEHFQLNAEEEGQVAGIIAAVERQGFYVNIGGENTHLFGTDTYSVVNDHLIALGEIHPHILKTIFVTAAVINTAGINTYCLFTLVVIHVLVFRHFCLSPLKKGRYGYFRFNNRI